jgi:hypothetical protein
MVVNKKYYYGQRREKNITPEHFFNPLPSPSILHDLSNPYIAQVTLNTRKNQRGVNNGEWVLFPIVQETDLFKSSI